MNLINGAGRRHAFDSIENVLKFLSIREIEYDLTQLTIDLSFDNVRHIISPDPMNIKILIVCVELNNFTGSLEL